MRGFAGGIFVIKNRFGVFTLLSSTCSHTTYYIQHNSYLHNISNYIYNIYSFIICIFSI